MLLHAVLLASISLPRVGRSATFVVSSPLDEIDSSPGDGICASASGACTLRAAIQEANSLVGADEVQIPAGTYGLGIPGDIEDACATGDLDVSDELAIAGAGSASTVIDGAGIDRILDARAALSVSGLTLTGGSAPLRGPGGGAIYTLAALALTDCVLADNHAQGGGAVVFEDEALGQIERCVFRDNSDGALLLTDDTVVTVVDSVFLRNEGPYGGAIGTGGAPRLTLRRCHFEQNRATRDLNSSGVGGAIAVDSIEPMLIEDTQFVGNTAESLGGAIWGNPNVYVTLRRVTISACTALRDGGAVHLTGYSDTYLAIIDSTIEGNSSSGPCGGIFLEGPQCCAPAALTLVNSTLSGNSGNSIVVTSWAAVHALNTTIVSGQLGIDATNESVVDLGRSIVAGSSSSDCTSTVTSLGHNIFGSQAFCTITGDTSTDLVGVDPLLGPLDDNGGPTFTHALLAGSTAIDAAADTCVDETGAPLLADQRGAPRPADGDGDGVAGCDIGAYEKDGCGATDSDGDTLHDDCDCAPADPGAMREPFQADLRVARDAATGDALVTWQDLASRAGNSTLHEVASSSIGALWTARVADGPCVAAGLPGLSWSDPRAVTDRGWCYLVRGVNACGPPTGEGWGSDSLGVARPACP